MEQWSQEINKQSQQYFRFQVSLLKQKETVGRLSTSFTPMSSPRSRASRGDVLATNDACVYNRVHASAFPRVKTRGQPGEYVGKYKVMLINFWLF